MTLNNILEFRYIDKDGPKEIKLNYLLTNVSTGCSKIVLNQLHLDLAKVRGCCLPELMSSFQNIRLSHHSSSAPLSGGEQG